MIPTASARVASVLLVAVALVAALLIAQSVAAVLAWRDVFPHYDMILVDYRWFTPPKRDFWIFHDNEHLPLVAMPFFWADLALFGGQGLFLVLCNIALAAGVALATWPAIRDATRNRPALAFATASLAALGMLWLQNRANLAWPKQTHMYLASFALAIAFARTAFPGPATAGRAAGICAALAIATFSFGFGIIGFVPVALLALQRRWPFRPALLLPATFAACLVLYLALGGGLGLAHETAPLTRDPTHTLVAIATYAANFVAAPVILACSTLTPFPRAETIGWGAATIALALLVWRVLRGFRRPPDRLDAWFALAGLFTVGNALETAIARAARFGIHGAVEYRYVAGEMPFWIGLLLFLLRSLARAPTPVLAFAALAALALEFGIHRSQHVEEINLRTLAAIRWQAALAALDHVDDRALFGDVIWNDASQVEGAIAGLQAHRLSAFAWPQARWLGRDLAAFGPATDTCEGAVRHATPVPGTGMSALEGWTASSSANPPGRNWILLADGRGRVVGLAHDGEKNDELMRTRPDLSLLFAGWQGYAPTRDLPDLAAWLVLPDHRVCRIPGHPPAGVA